MSFPEEDRTAEKNSTSQPITAGRISITTEYSTTLFLIALCILSFLGYDSLEHTKATAVSLAHQFTAMQFTASKSTKTIKLSKSERSDYGFQRVGYERYKYFGDAADETLTYKILADHDTILEPNVDMEMMYYGDDETILSDKSLYYEYTVSVKSSGAEIGSGTYYPSDDDQSYSINLACTPLNALTIKVVKYSPKSEKTFTLSALCMYVRREIRDLTDEDLSRAMDAMYTMWSTSDTAGQKLYGDAYHCATFFASMHDFNAAWADGDHIHEGLGFLPQHIKMTNLFEASMQAVDPSVSLFYWDFTIESTASMEIFDSPMFTASTFGTLTPSKSGASSDYQWLWSTDEVTDGYIADGRWKATKAQRNPFEDDMPSAYGYMRGPWCMNPSPRITRYPAYKDSKFGLGLPSCRTYVSWVQDDSKMSFLKTAEDSPHAIAHGTIGGVFGCDALEEMQTAGYLSKDSTDLASVCLKWTFFMKELYRASLLRPSTDCSAKSLDEDSLKCAFTCPDEQADDWISVFSGFAVSSYVPDNMGKKGWEAWRQFACNGNGYKIFTGDQLESGSPADPSFWPIHPTQERLYHAKMMSGGFETEEWPTEACGAKSCDWVCNHAKCYDYTGAESKKDYYDTCCEGHYEDDQLLDYASGNREKKYGITNRQLFLDTDPTSKDYAMTYIYDKFEWEHCAALNSNAKDIKKAVQTLAADKRRRRHLRVATKM